AQQRRLRLRARRRVVRQSVLRRPLRSAGLPRRHLQPGARSVAGAARFVRGPTGSIESFAEVRQIRWLLRSSAGSGGGRARVAWPRDPKARDRVAPELRRRWATQNREYIHSLFFRPMSTNV